MNIISIKQFIFSGSRLQSVISLNVHSPEHHILVMKKNIENEYYFNKAIYIFRLVFSDILDSLHSESDLQTS